MPPVLIPYEQAVYGTFPFWDKGYAILARSPNCRDEWIADLRAVCQRYGERPAGAADAGGLLALKLPSGPWAIIGPCPQGCDDRGRPGALAFHALFLSGSDYRKAGAFPFDLAHHHCKDWTAETTTLPSGTMLLDNVPSAEPSPTDNLQAMQIASALAKGRRVALEAPGPIDDLARQIWMALPLRRRAKLSLATWTFAVANRHDLLALPRLAGVTLDRSYVDLTSLGTSPPRRPSHILRNRRSNPLAEPCHRCIHDAQPRLASGPSPIRLVAIVDVSESHLIPLNHPPERKTIRQFLSIASRLRRAFSRWRNALGRSIPSYPLSDLDTDALMMRLRERLAYRDSSLTPDEVNELRQSISPARPLAWHTHIDLFRPDRPLPNDFTQGPLDWQLRVLAWSFHLNPANRPPEEIPHFLSESLSLPFPVHATTSHRPLSRAQSLCPISSAAAGTVEVLKLQPRPARSSR